jgi:DNA-binding NtrC family response regulator
MPRRVKCLVIEDDAQVRGLLTSLLSQLEFAVTATPSAEEGIEAAEAGRFDVALCDISLPGRSGIAAVGALRDACADLPVILVTGYPSVESAIEGMRAGAFDYITKPFNREELLMVLERALDHSALERENRTLRNLARRSRSFAGVIAESPAMRDIVSRIQRIAGSRSNVLLTGESGTGKEVISRAIHQTGPSANEPFVAINCSAIPGELLETELFGHVRKRGLFEEAGRGTLFLDEIGELDLGLQSKLLRALQQREVRPVGGTRSVTVKARVISATNTNLREAIDTGRFRRDLFYRLNVIPIHVPALRERIEDIPPLAEHFLEKHSGAANAGWHLRRWPCSSDAAGRGTSGSSRT